MVLIVMQLPIIIVPDNVYRIFITRGEIIKIKNRLRQLISLFETTVLEPDQIGLTVSLMIGAH
jgi:signal peptidase I